MEHQGYVESTAGQSEIVERIDLIPLSSQRQPARSRRSRQRQGSSTPLCDRRATLVISSDGFFRARRRAGDTTSFASEKSPRGLKARGDAELRGPPFRPLPFTQRRVSRRLSVGFCALCSSSRDTPCSARGTPCMAPRVLTLARLQDTVLRDAGARL